MRGIKGPKKSAVKAAGWPEEVVVEGRGGGGV